MTSLSPPKKPRLTPKHLFILLDLYDRLQVAPVFRCWDAAFKKELLDLSDMRFIEWTAKSGFRVTPVGVRVVEERSK